MRPPNAGAKKEYVLFLMPIEGTCKPGRTQKRQHVLKWLNAWCFTTVLPISKCKFLDGAVNLSSQYTIAKVGLFCSFLDDFSVFFLLVCKHLRWTWRFLEFLKSDLCFYRKTILLFDENFTFQSRKPFRSWKQLYFQHRSNNDAFRESSEVPRLRIVFPGVFLQNPNDSAGTSHSENQAALLR